MTIGDLSWKTGKHIIIPVLVLVLITFSALFFYLYPIIGRAAGTLGMIPIFFGALYFKLPGGLISAAVAFLIQSYLLLLHGYSEPMFSSSRLFVFGIELSSGLFLGLVFAGIEHGRKVRRRLEESEEKLKEAHRIAGLAHWEYTGISANVAWSEGLYSILGVSGRNQKLKDKDFLSFVHEEDRTALIETLKFHGKQMAPLNIDFRIKRPNGELRYLKAIGRYDEKRRKWRGTIQDITVFKNNEAALRRAKEEAERANRAKNEFLSNVSHEIRTPISGIIGLTELLYNAELPSEPKEHIEMIGQSAEHLLSIINEILDLSKIESGRLSLVDKPFSIDELCRTIESIVTVQTIKKGLDFTVSCGSDLPRRLSGDEQRLRQICLNLLGNAVKFTDKGKIEFRIEKEREEDDRVRLLFTVIDSGPGIPAEHHREIFDGFVQLDSGFNKMHQGTGLGLRIAKVFTEMMGGRIWVRSTPGSGSTFFLSIPFRSAGPAINEGESGIAQGKGVKTAAGKVLLAEDNRINQRVIKKMLENNGHSVEVADNGITALQKLKDAGFDCILMDIQMPEMDGIEAAQRIRAGEAGEENSSIPIIALTAFAMEREIAKIKQSGFDDVFIKPISADVLAAGIDAVLGRSGNEN